MTHPTPDSAAPVFFSPSNDPPFGGLGGNHLGLVVVLCVVPVRDVQCILYCGGIVVKNRQAANRPVLACILSVTFFVDDLYSDFSPCLWSAVFVQKDFVEDLSELFFRSFTAIF